MKPFKVALVDLDGFTVPDWVKAELRKEQIDFCFEDCHSQRDLGRVAGDADLVWLFGGSPILRAGSFADIPRCGAILRTGSGTDNVPVVEATQLGIVVANTPEAHSDAVADHTIALLFAVVRQIVNYDRILRTGFWERAKYPLHGPVAGRTLGLVGFGHIPRIVTKRLSGFKMRFLAYDPYVSAEIMTVHGVQSTGLDELLKQSDVVSLHCPLTKDTYHRVGAREFQLMKRTAILLNTSRGPVVQEKALVQALSERWIAGAGMDVFHEEPVSPNHPLLKLENVVVTPHIAGGGAETLAARWQLSVETIVALARGQWPRSYVNREVKPRWDLRGMKN